MTHGFIVDNNLVEQIEGMSTEYPYCMHTRDLTNIIIPWHWHEELELGYIQNGTSKIITLEEEFVIHQGDGFFINKNVMDMKRNAVPGTRTIEINHIFHPLFLSGHFRSIFETKYISPITNNRNISVHIIRRGHETADRLLDNLIRLKTLQSADDTEMQTRSILSESWLLLMEDIRNYFQPDTAKHTEAQDRLQSMIAFIHRNYQEKISSAQIAEQAGISEREAVRTFQKALSMSPIEYLITYRLNESLKLLTGTELTITEISYLCGFSDSAYFGKTFRKAYHMTPSEFRATKHR